MEKPIHTPLMEQYFSLKKAYPDALVFFQVGDFYELFFQDAIDASAYLALTLTKRGKTNGEDIPLCGVPMHASMHYITKLVRGGFHVVVCDQMSKPQPGVLVERAVSRVYTPGTLTDDALLESSVSTILSVVELDTVRGEFVILALDILQNELLCIHGGEHGASSSHGTQRPVIPTHGGEHVASSSRGAQRRGDPVFWNDLETELYRFSPSEILISPSAPELLSQLTQWGYRTQVVQDFVIASETEASMATEMSHIQTNDSSILSSVSLAERARAILRSYLARTERAALEALPAIRHIEPARFVGVDAPTSKTLELIETQRGERRGSLLATLDTTLTPMGARLMRAWLVRPRTEHAEITARLDRVESLVRSHAIRDESGRLLRCIGDLERVAGRCALRRATTSDYRTLLRALPAFDALQERLGVLGGVLAADSARLPDIKPLQRLIEAVLSGDEQEQVIRSGFCPELDTLRATEERARESLFALAHEAREASGLSSLKLVYTGTAGYFFEVTKAQSTRVPSSFIPLQGLANRERYTTAELRAGEIALIEASGAREAREAFLFAQFTEQVREFVQPLRRISSFIAHFDCFRSCAQTAYEYRYVRPVLLERGASSVIRGGRHPVVERLCGLENFVPNDTRFDQHRSIIMTGPNMGGKSTYLRQTALITLMAHCGMFVPAAEAHIALVDQIFTRIGSGDAVGEGKSTFYIEMEETARICRAATSDSLVILDEVGRGTSTDDGQALAHAIVEYLTERIRCATLFATHYHTLALLSTVLPGVANYSVACEKRNGTLFFLHTVIPGAASESYGIDVAELADVPADIVARARQLKR